MSQPRFISKFLLSSAVHFFTLKITRLTLPEAGRKRSKRTIQSDHMVSGWETGNKTNLRKVSFSSWQRHQCVNLIHTFIIPIGLFLYQYNFRIRLGGGLFISWEILSITLHTRYSSRSNFKINFKPRNYIPLTSFFLNTFTPLFPKLSFWTRNFKAEWPNRHSNILTIRNVIHLDGNCLNLGESPLPIHLSGSLDPL